MDEYEENHPLKLNNYNVYNSKGSCKEEKFELNMNLGTIDIVYSIYIRLLKRWSIYC